MWPLNESIKRTNRECEAIENDETYGRIIVEDKKAYLCEVDSNYKFFKITKDHRIDALNNEGRFRVTLEDILTTTDSFDNKTLIFVGIEAFVK